MAMSSGQKFWSRNGLQPPRESLLVSAVVRPKLLAAKIQRGRNKKKIQPLAKTVVYSINQLIHITQRYRYCIQVLYPGRFVSQTSCKLDVDFQDVLYPGRSLTGRLVNRTFYNWTFGNWKFCGLPFRTLSSTENISYISVQSLVFQCLKIAMNKAYNISNY